jgi:hypothetical protein
MIPAEHLIIRQIKKWRSYGILGKGPIVDILIKDIEDEHLLNIIRHLEERSQGASYKGRSNFLPTVYETMHDEIAWRMLDCWVRIS